MRPRLPCKSVLLFQIRSFLGVFPFCRAGHLFPFTEFLPHGRVLFPLFPGPALRFAVSFRQSPHFQTVFRWSSWHAIFLFLIPRFLFLAVPFSAGFLYSNMLIITALRSVKLRSTFKKYPASHPSTDRNGPRQRDSLPPSGAGSGHHGNVRGLNKASRARLCARIA